METSASVQGINRRPRLHLRFFTSFALAFVAIVLVSGLFYKSLTTTVEKQSRGLLVNTENYRRSGVSIGVIVPRRTDRGDNMASTDQRFNWSQLVGMKAEEAKKKIQEEHPHLHVVVLSKDAMMTMDYNLRRVRIFKDENGKVTSVPKLG